MKYLMVYDAGFDDVVQRAIRQISSQGRNQNVTLAMFRDEFATRTEAPSLCAYNR